jgi:hypothetical protein
MEAQHVVILLDIHNSIVDPYRSQSTEKIFWNGQDLAIWENHLATLKENGHEKGIEIHYGIVHSKSEYRHKPTKIQKEENGHTLIDPDLIYITDTPASICQALHQAKKAVEHKFGVIVEETDAWVINGDMRIFRSICESLNLEFTQVSQVGHRSKMPFRPMRYEAEKMLQN